MNLDNLHKKYMVGFLLLATVVLIVVSVVQPSNFLFKPAPVKIVTPDEQAKEDAAQYAKLMDELKPDYTASKNVLQDVVSKEMVTDEVKTALQVDRKVVIPTIADSELKISPRKDKAVITNYLNAFGSMITNYNDSVAQASQEIYDFTAPNSSIAKEASTKTAQFVQNLRGMQVPVEAVKMHKASIVAYQKFKDVFDTAASYADNPNSEPWAAGYEQYVIINDSSAIVNTELANLNKEYALNDMPLSMESGNFLIKSANAGIPVIDIWNVALQTLKQALARLFAQYFIKLSDKLVTHIEQSFTIVSQLYYTDELNRYYSDEYLKKFIKDPLDQTIIKKFLPKYYCVNKDQNELNKIFTLKAQQSSEPYQNIDYNGDPMWFEMAYNFVAPPERYLQYYEDAYQTAANEDQARSGTAVTDEKNGTGLKTPHDFVTNTITKASSIIFDTQQAAIQNTMSLGTTNVENIVGQLVGGVLANLINKYVFIPANGGTEQVAVESSVCLKNPLRKYILPITPEPIGSPPSVNFPIPSGT